MKRKTLYYCKEHVPSFINPVKFKITGDPQLCIHCEWKRQMKEKAKKGGYVGC